VLKRVALTVPMRGVLTYYGIKGGKSGREWTANPEGKIKALSHGDA
tara:strand:- start:1114 stop:1251 length:138 start_codon:yes stop_codon:yes gene_type:complete